MNGSAQERGWSGRMSDYAIERALSMLCESERPLILAGGGIRVANAFEPLRQLAEQLDIPVYTSFMGKGALPYDH